MTPRLAAHAAAAALCIAAASPAAAVGLLLADGMLHNPGDLTRVQIDGGPTVLEFLDLSLTDGMSVAAAVAQYGRHDFRWADGADMRALFSAFGMSYANAAGAVSLITSSQAQRAAFVGRLSTTVISGSLGFVDDLTTPTLHTFVCVGTGMRACEGNSPPGGSFVANLPFNWPSNPALGVFLVRAVPEPSAWLLMAGGVAVLAAGARRRAAQAAQSSRG